MIDIKNVELITENNHHISTKFIDPAREIKAAVVIAPALGVDKAFYQDFALWLVDLGFRVVTFDYSFMDASSLDSYKNSEVTITDWATFDCKKVLETVHEQAQGKDIYWIGHSLGGQITAMIPNIHLVSKVITIASGSGYWRQNAAPLKYKVWFLWYFAAPALLKVLGYFPGKRLGMVGNLPFGVMSQWRKWCLHPEYFLGVENKQIKDCYQNFNKPITSLSFSDDQLMSQENIRSLHRFFGKTNAKMQVIVPDKIGVSKVGHFGFFKDKFKSNLWELYLLPELSIKPE
jgi:predicted alpha/beta hydrolase